MRIAIVHDWLVVYAGAERVLEQILDCYPDADLFSLVDFLPANQRGFIRDKSVKTSFIQHLPGARKIYRAYLPAMPLAVERFDFSGYDLIITTSHAVVKGIITSADQLHICYMQARNIKYAYEDRFLYKSNKILQFIQDIFLTRLRVWDSIASQRPDVTVANSDFVSRWHTHRHNIACSVIYPPVDISFFAEKFSLWKEDYYVTVGRIEPYKRFDIIIKAFNNLGLKLKVIGDGTLLKDLQSTANSNIEFLGYLRPDEVASIVGKAKAFVFASREDFGIAPLEAQACGTPVIAFGKGGVQETIIPLPDSEDTALPSAPPSGLFFYEQTVDSIIAAVERFEAAGAVITPESCRQNALRFAPERFRTELKALVQREWMSFRVVK